MGRPPDDGKRGPIVFGTSGWRGVFGEDFTFPRVRAAAHAVGRWLAEEATGREVVVAHDTRFLGDRMADMTAAILRAHGSVPILGRGAVPTPAAARAVLRRRAAAAVVFTASHNPPEYQGMKVFGHWGGSLGKEQTRRIEAIAAAGAAEGEAPAGGALPRRVDLVTPYLRELLRQLDREALARSRLRVVYDAMHGAGSGVTDTALERCGVRVRTLRGDPDPRFGGSAPDPTPRRLRALSRAVRDTKGLSLGLATDGDADRFAAVDSDGRVLSETQALALLVDHLARTGRVERGVAISFATGSLVERVANSYGLRVERHPIGFKFLSQALLAGKVDAAGEESGGFALGGFGRDKDGILASCLLAEIVAQTRVPLGERLAELARRHGSSACGRLAMPLQPAAQAALERLSAAPPAMVDDSPVRAVAREDGLHLALDEGFVMLRVSGTEPVLRVYAEARGPRRLKRRLAAGLALLGAARREPLKNAG